MLIFKKIFIFAIYLFAFCSSFNSLAKDNLAATIKNKQANVIFLRHALAPGYGDPKDFDLNNCNKQRNLNKIGRNQAKNIGKYFLRNKIKFDEILSSEWCRCKDTAKELNIGKWETFSGLNSFFQSYSDKEKVLNLLRNKLNNIDKNSLNLMITHQVVIAEITGIYTHSGGIVIYNSYNKTAKEIKIE